MCVYPISLRNTSPSPSITIDGLQLLGPSCICPKCLSGRPLSVSHTHRPSRDEPFCRYSARDGWAVGSSAESFHIFLFLSLPRSLSLSTCLWMCVQHSGEDESGKKTIQEAEENREKMARISNNKTKICATTSYTYKDK